MCSLSCEVAFKGYVLVRLQHTVLHDVMVRVWSADDLACTAIAHTAFYFTTGHGSLVTSVYAGTSHARQ